MLEELERRLGPAVFAVNTFADTAEAVRDGSGLDADGNISLRSAVMAVNDLGSGSEAIVLPAGTYPLNLAGEDSGDAAGSLKIGSGLAQIALDIAGDPANATVIDANGIDRAFVIGFFTAVSLSDLTIANGSTSGFGGAINNAGRLTLTNDTITSSVAAVGGGVFNSGTLTVSYGTVTGNATTVTGAGGGLYNQGRMSVTTTTVAGNSATSGGGLFNLGSLGLTASTVANNTADNGGGIFNQGEMALTNDTVAQNAADAGGGIYTYGYGAVTLLNCTVAATSATGSSYSAGGGIFVGIGSQQVQLRNTLVALNVSDSGPDIQGTVVSQGHNLVGDGTGAAGFADSDFVGTSDSPIDPHLGPLQDNGGPTQTMALLDGSLAIANGDPDGAPTVDQRGFSRDGTVDIGAYQTEP
jgi:hypothetical protein